MNKNILYTLIALLSFSAHSFKFDKKYTMRQPDALSDGTHKVAKGAQVIEETTSNEMKLAVLPKGAIFLFMGTCPQGSSAVREMAGRTAVGAGPLNDGTLSHHYRINEQGGSQRHKLTKSEMPRHQHIMAWGETYRDKDWSPYGVAGGRGYIGSGDSDRDNYRYLNSPEGGSQFHENRMPYRVMNYCMVK
ncbi:hypothetical protein [Photobacterium galatheae]|uniref:Phage tail collar domain-containing protein n=1 Tax=Photobacterium galatheae TaxID=1654360 RepID=A0A066RUI0_9GAMM|nr:hypothetical protein [Photobacterium galatheae]KDM91043.1 hypothetical protein EA58_14950 [Photobacterium galatheae]MCM0149006.1 hypothetical protein [Photobacterium galatheae]